MMKKRMTQTRQIVPLLVTGLLVTAGFFGFMPALGDDHWDPEPPQDPETGRFLLDTFDEFESRGAYGSWITASPDRAAQTDGQARPSFFTTDRGYQNVDLHTDIRTPANPSNDNGFIGFVVSFKEPAGAGDDYDAIIIDWSSKNLTMGSQSAREGLTLYQIQGEVPDDNIAMRDCFFAKDDDSCPADITVLSTFLIDEEDRPGGYRNTTEDRGWVAGGEEYEVRIQLRGDHPQASHTPGIIVSVKGGPAEDWNPYNGTFRDTVQTSFEAEPESIGFYTFRQGGSQNGAAQFQNPSYADAIKPEIHLESICPEGELWFGGWCSAPVAIELDVLDAGSGLASVACTISGSPLEDCDREHEEPGVFPLDLQEFEHVGPTGSWDVAADGSEATQTEAGGGVSFLTSDSGNLARDGLYLDVDYHAEIDAPPSGAQNNIIGFAFGLTRPTGGGTLVESYVIDWKAEEQTHLGHTAPEGLTFYRIDGSVGTTDAEIFACYWGKDPAACDAATGGSAQLEVLAEHTGPGTGWEHDADYTLRLEHYADRVALTVQGGTNYADETTAIEVNDEGAFEEVGFFGPYNFRQEDVTYRNIAFEELGLQVAVHGAQLTVDSVDHAGNKNVRELDLKIDLQNPDVSAEVDCTLVNGWCNDDADLSVSASALSGIMSTNCALDGSPVSCGDPVTEDGAYVFDAEAFSFVQRTGTDTAAFQRDATAPDGAIVEPVPGCSYIDDDATLCLGVTTVIGQLSFEVTGSDGIVNGVASGLDRAEFYENGEMFATETNDGSGWFNTTWTPNGIGDQSVEVHLIDAAGNVEILEYSAIVLL